MTKNVEEKIKYSHAVITAYLGGKKLCELQPITFTKKDNTIRDDEDAPKIR